MAINLGATYPGRIFVDGENPRGTFKDSTTPGAFDGTPAQYAWARDMWAFLEKLLNVGGITASGTPDTAANSQRYDALLLAARDVWPRWDSEHIYLKGGLTVGSNDKLYQSLQTANLNKNPVLEPSWWKIFEPIDVIDNLLSTDPLAALSARQGKILKDLIDDPPPATQTSRGASFLLKSIEISRITTLLIGFSSGVFDFDDGTGQAVGLGWQKIISLAWAPGNGVGGLDTGAVAPDTWYYTYAIYNPTSGLSDYLFTASLGAPTMPSDYTKKEYRGHFKTNVSSQINPFYQNKNIFTFETPIEDVDNVNVNSTSQLFTMSVPPGIKCLLTLHAFIQTGPSIFPICLISDPDIADRVLSVTWGIPPLPNLFRVETGFVSSADSEQIQIMTNTAAQIRVRTAHATASAISIESYSYKDMLLRVN